VGLGILFSFFLAGCGAAGTPRPIVVTVTSSAKATDQGMTVTVNAAVANDAKNAGVTWTVSGGGTLTNMTASSVTYNAPASVSSAQIATVTATSVTNPSQSASVQITVNLAPVITTTSLTAATAGTGYSTTINASGGTGPFTWSLSSGTLPNGLSLGSSTSGSVTISGTPTAAATASITVKCADSVGASTTQTLTVTVNPPPPLTITTSSLSAGVMGTAYSQTLQASGGIPGYKWGITAGSLPQGLSLNGSTGVISGTPSGTFTSASNFTVQVTDSETPTAATKTANLNISISAPPLSVTTTSLPGGTQGSAYSQTLQAAGGVSPYTWTITSGSLPPGLSLGASSGTITGTPTTLGTSNFTIQVSDSETPTAQTATANLSITINRAPLVVTTTSSQLPTGVVSSPYPSTTLQATGGTPPYTWSVTSGSLPAGLSLNTSSGAISGTPTASGTSNFTVQVKDNAGRTATAGLSITVNAALAIAATSLPGGTVGTAYGTNVNATGGVQPYTWSITSGSLPSGLSLNASSGNISGTPTGTGTASFTVTVTDSETPAISAHQNLSINIDAASCTNNSSLQGKYAYLVQGWNGAAGEVFFGMAGQFVADGTGNITAGQFDLNDAGGFGPGTGTFTGTYCVTSNNLGTMTISGTKYANSFTDTLAFAVQSNGNGNIIYYDTGTIQASGVLLKQDTSAFATSKFTGSYAMGAIGADYSGSREGMAGAFIANGTATLSNGIVDIDDSGILVSAATFASSNFSISSSGRGFVTLNITGVNTQDYALYVVNASQLLMVGIDNVHNFPLPPLLTGQIVQQANAPYTAVSLNGISVIGVQGSGPNATAGLVTTDGVSSFSINADQNNAGTLGTLSGTGTYTVSSNGRVVISGIGNHSPILYLTGQNTGFLVGTDSSILSGQLWAQSGSNFTNSSISGNYYGGGWQPVASTVGEDIAQIAINSGSFTLNGFSNSTQSNGTGNPTSNSQSGTYSVSSNGRTVISVSGSQVGVLYIISPSHFVFVDTASNNPKIEAYQK
jgi:Putative Ig domain